MATALTALRSLVQLNAPGCPLPIVDFAILNALIDFFARSRAYRHTPAQITVVSGTGEYEPTIPDGMEIAWLLDAELDETENSLSCVPPDEIPVLWATEQGTPTLAALVNPTTVGLRKVPDAGGTLDIRVALRPTDGCTEYPDEFHILYREQLAAGALARLYDMPNRPWSAPNSVASAKASFERAVLDAEYRADRGASNAPARTALNLIGGH